MRRALITLIAALAGAQAVAQPATAPPAPAVFLVRHAERADATSGGTMMMASDPDLSEAGHARAARLAAMLRDAGITGIFTTEYKRTRQTAEPLARRLGIEPVAIPAKDVAALLEKLKGASGNVLVVGHSNSVPGVIEALGVTGPIAIADDEFDNLFIVTPGTPARLVRLRY
jgi:broad specificity phosphatase PhoE